MLMRSFRAWAGLVVVLATVHPRFTRADDSAPAALDETSFLARVAERSPRRAVLDARVRAATAASDAASPRINPTLSYEREAVPSLDASDDFVRLGIELDLGGRRGLARRAAGASARADRSDVEGDAHAYVLEARLAYLDAVHARELAARLDEARIALAGLVEALRSRARQGDTSSYDAERAILELDNLDDDRASAHRRLVIANLRLGSFLGEPATAYRASDPLTLPPGVTAPLPAPQRFEVDAALSRAARAELEARAARQSWIPRLDVTVGMIASRGVDSDGIGYVVGVGGELPLLERGTAAAARARAEARRWHAEAQALGVEASADIEQARRDLTARIAQAEVYAAGPARRAGDLARRAAVAYREGDRPILELLDAQRTARQSTLRAIELVYEARRAELALRRALGRSR